MYNDKKQLDANRLMPFQDCKYDFMQLIIAVN